MAETQKMYTSGGKVEHPSSYNNNIAEISGDGISYPADEDIVRFWAFTCSQQSWGRNLLQITTKKAVGLPKCVKNAYTVDFKGYAYDKDVNKNLKSELKWMRADSSTDQLVKLSMHDPIKPNKYDFPYVLCTYKLKDVVTPFAVHQDDISSLDSSTIVFKIQNASLGSISLFTISENEQPSSLSSHFIGRTPDGDAIRITSFLQPSLVNPMTLMFMSDQGPRRQDK
ncbi:uncharacterized protein LOC117100835 [Anneissia japonica]|uniref:uncharacterized protein LOC117100835 n=1 Tax=Anneissia japonica TaxID=1529436 RepID=UPI00142570DD|nr:uncharacterized protein LOC117100835 [Anneissia japonica]